MNPTILPQDVAISLATQAIQDGFKFENLHAYTDKKGDPLYWRIRLKNPETKEKWIRPMYIHQDKYKMGEPKFSGKKPLYQLHTLVSRPTETVFICEGEKCVDALLSLGLLATTSGGADSAERTDWSDLQNRSVILWPDHDEAGNRYVQIVSNILRQLNCVIKLIDINSLNLRAKEDVIDWLVTHPNATAADILALKTLDMTVETISESISSSNEILEEQQSQASLLVAFVRKNMSLYHDKNGETYAQNLETKENRKIESRQFKDWLIGHFYEATQKSPRDQSLREALATLNAIARIQGACHEVNIRVAQHQKIYFIDLGERGNSRAIEISEGEWKINTFPPVRFLRPDSLQPLPEPIIHTDFSILWEMINIPEESRLLIVAWLAECLRPDTPFPILELIGEQGSAKSTTQAMLRSLIDPNSCNLRSAPKVVEDIFVSANSSYLVSYENISHLSAPMQDALCVLATGGGFAKRKLYSDMDESIINVKRPIVLNGISAAITAQDLVDRTLSIELPIITSRVEVTELWHAFEKEKGKLFGALLTVMSTALSLLPSIELSAQDRPRLVEFAKFGMAIAQAMNEPQMKFLDQFNAARQESIARTIDASPVASALVDWFEHSDRRVTVLPIKELFKRIEDFKPHNTDSWPRSAKGFADALRRAAPALRQIGIQCKSLGKTGGFILWEIKPAE
jgi:hypothetical protein